MLGSHESDEFDESEETNQFRELAEFGSSLFPDHVKLAGRNQWSILSDMSSIRLLVIIIWRLFCTDHSGGWQSNSFMKHPTTLDFIWSLTRASIVSSLLGRMMAVCWHRFHSSLVNELIKRRNLNMLILSTLKKLKKKTIECLSPPFLGTGSNNCNWAAIAPVEKRLINIGDQIMIIVVYDMLLCEDDFQNQPVEGPATTSPGNCLLNLTRASL